MENRIEINGVWYVREDLTNHKKINIVEDLTHTEHYVFESSKYTFDAVRIYKNTNEFYPGFEIRFRDNTNNYEDVWDLESFFYGILDGNPESINAAKDDLDDNGIELLFDILTFLKNQRWFNF